jgi:catechol 2,3-dioxygenase-like lactoylglutathione lyase family enzyme
MYTGSNVTLMVSDLSASVEWYTEVLGLDLQFRAGDEWAEISGPDITIGLHQAGEHGPQPGSSGAVSLGFQVKDFEEAVAALRERGVQMKGDPVIDGPIRLGFFEDPDGVSLYLCQAVQ